MAYFLAIPAFLSLLVLAAHFLRMSFLPGVAIALLLAIVLLFRVNWITRIAQVALLLAGLEWLRATLSLINERQAEGADWHRAAVILLSVEGFTVLSAILLQWVIRKPAAIVESPPAQS